MVCYLGGRFYKMRKLLKKIIDFFHYRFILKLYRYQLMFFQKSGVGCTEIILCNIMGKYFISNT